MAASCQFGSMNDTTEPVQPECGNGVIEGDELCDGDDLGGATCPSVDPEVFAGGTLACNASCDGFTTDQCDSGDCCSETFNDGCEVAAITNCVCDFDPLCCDSNEVGWDNTCIEEGIDECGSICL